MICASVSHLCFLPSSVVLLALNLFRDANDGESEIGMVHAVADDLFKTIICAFDSIAKICACHLPLVVIYLPFCMQYDRFPIAGIGANSRSQ